MTIFHMLIYEGCLSIVQKKKPARENAAGFRYLQRRRIQNYIKQFHQILASCEQQEQQIYQEFQTYHRPFQPRQWLIWLRQ